MLAEMLSNAADVAFEQLQESLLDSIGETITSKIQEFANSFKKAKRIITYKTEVLTKKDLIEIAASNIVADSSEVVLYKVSNKSEYLIYLAYAKDRELLSESENRYITISCTSMAHDVDELFDGHQMIILK